MKEGSMSKRVTFSSKSGAQASGEIAEPEGSGKAPAVVLVQEWWGINDHIRSLLDRLAKAGFVAVAPDLFHGTVAKNADEASKLMSQLDWPRAIDEIAGAASFVEAHPRSNGKVGIMGFCMGGALTFASASQIPTFAAAVPFYGIPAQADWSKVKAPVMAHFAKRDELAKADVAEQIKKQIESHGGSMKLFVYDADHAFVNDTRPEVYAPKAAAEAWDRSIQFLKTHLGS
jgi:carboxymethylenebutenolidase